MRRDSEDQVTDEALLSGVALGDERCALLFVRRFQRRLFGLAQGIVGDPAAAEDVTQEAFLRILRHAAVFDARRGSAATWALTITRNLAIDATRLRRAVVTSPTDTVFLRLVNPSPAFEDVLARRDEATPALRALEGLPLEQRRCVLLAVIYGRTAQEIAAQESIALGTAKSRIRLGMAKLREAMVKESP